MQPRLRGRIPVIGFSTGHVRRIGKGHLTREPLLAGIDTIADEPRTLADSRCVIDGAGIMHPTCLHAEHGTPLMEAEIHRRPPVLVGIGEGPVHGLPVGDNGIAASSSP